MARFHSVPALSLVLAATFAGTLNAQAQVQAFYPLLTDLLDATANNGPVSLLGTTPPNPPNNGVCHNGIYFYNSGGQDIRTPLFPNLNTTDFEIDVEFNITALQSYFAPVIMGGHLWRWLGIYLQPNGTVGIKHNNSNLAWSTTVLSTGVWYAGVLKFEAGNAELWIDGTQVLSVATGTLSDGNNKNITTNDFSNGSAFNGCIRNLRIVNDTSLAATAMPYGAGCAGGAGTPALVPTATPLLGTTFAMAASNLDPAAVFAFMSVGFSYTSSPFGPLPLSLAPFGLGAFCDLLVSADATTLFPVSAGAGAFTFDVPANQSLAGFHLYFQCASIDTAATGGFALSNGVAATLN
ncbi:MAG: LamG-like jellyroll fold domain-containing protein [Planctomycetota bacterium]